MFGINKGNTAATVPTNPMGSGIAAGNTAAFPAAPQIGVLDQVRNGLANMQANQAAMSPEQKRRQEMLSTLGNEPQAQFSQVQFGGAGNNGGALAQYLEMLKKQGGM